MAEEFLVNENADYFELRPPTIPRFYADADGNYLGSFDGLDEEIPADMANGIEVPVPPQDGLQLWDGDKWLPAAPTPDMLTEEVNRRLSLGFDYDLGDGRGVHHFGTTDADMKRWMQDNASCASRCEHGRAQQADRNQDRYRPDFRHGFRVVACP